MNNHEGGPEPITGSAGMPLDNQMDYWNNRLGINVQNDCGCDKLRDLIQGKINKGDGRRYVGTDLPT